MTPDTMEINGSKYVRESIWLEAERELSAVSAAIGSVRWMDPPDGGSVTLAEQVGRMREHIERLESALEPFALVSSEGLIGKPGDQEFAKITMAADYFHAAAHAVQS